MEAEHSTMSKNIFKLSVTGVEMHFTIFDSQLAGFRGMDFLVMVKPWDLKSNMQFTVYSWPKFTGVYNGIFHLSNESAS